jgi:phosphoenolpyruvate carboxylase
MKVNNLNFILASVDTIPLFSLNDSVYDHSLKSYMNINEKNNNTKNSITYTDDSKADNFIVNKNELYSTQINIIISQIEKIISQIKSAI